MYGLGQGQAAQCLIWKEACLTLDLLSLNRISQLSGFVMQRDLFAHPQSMEKEQDLEEHGPELSFIERFARNFPDIEHVCV